ncbi:type II secretion system F family protein [bacterium]|nr:type II secretion system F family protein [bacterium]
MSERFAALHAIGRVPRRIVEFWNQPTVKEVSVSLQLLALMLASGVDLALAFEALQRQIENDQLRLAFEDMESKVTRYGWRLSAALSEHRTIFPYYVMMLVQAGEEGGQIAGRLECAGRLMERDAQRSARVRSALTSPAITFTAAATIILLIARYVMPRFSEMYRGLNIPLPLPTRIALGMVAVVNHWLFPVVTLSTLVILYRQREVLKQHLFDWGLGMGPLRRWLGVMLAVEFCDILGSLVGEGVALARALVLMADQAPFWSYQARLKAVHKELIEEGDLAEALRRVDYFPVSVYAVMGVAQEVGSLDRLLAALKTTLEQQMESLVEALLALVEPLLIGSLGLFTAFFFLAMFIPIYGTLQAL